MGKLTLKYIAYPVAMVIMSNLIRLLWASPIFVEGYLDVLLLPGCVVVTCLCIVYVFDVLLVRCMHVVTHGLCNV